MVNCADRSIGSSLASQDVYPSSNPSRADICEPVFYIKLMRKVTLHKEYISAQRDTSQRGFVEYTCLIYVLGGNIWYEKSTNSQRIIGT